MDLETGGVKSACGLASSREDGLIAYSIAVISSGVNWRGVSSKLVNPRLIMATFTASALGDTVVPCAN